MKQSRIWIVFVMAAMLMTACSSGPTKEQSENAERVIETAHKQRETMTSCWHWPTVWRRTAV